MTRRLQTKIGPRYNRNVKPREFVAGDLVLRKSMGSIKDQNVGKFAPNWEGAYQVTAIAGTRAYYLKDMEDRPLP